MSSSKFTIRVAETPEDIATTRVLFLAYHAWLDIDLTFQDFESEVSSLPGKYAPVNGGRILLAYMGDEDWPVGCIALRDISDTFARWHVHTEPPDPARKIGEVKRLYTLPSARGCGIGSAMINAVLEAARQEGYAELRLDTLPRMQGAIKLYSRAGFVVTEKYYDTDLEGTIFMKYVV
ncbi:putative gnat family n [Mycena indigotica]|uniref:Putative gnat family n n=1 Tax=Mycena indigotica TaxID=2126181 RepID=A0A8H6T2Z0_9AGAR|nr:putative gnat family n [Mycena indigotica]KAF7309934.1 putative gnat family n [Mycena indigotica]